MQHGTDDADAALMRRIARRDPLAFRQLTDKHLGRSVRFVERLLGSRALAEEVVQEAFEAVWKQAGRWEPTARFSTWLHRVLANIAARHFRDRLRDHAPLDDSLPDPGPGTEEAVAARERREAVKGALLALPAQQRLALVLFHYEELSQREACQVMGLGESALESLLFRARAGMRKRLAALAPQDKEPHHDL